MKRTGARREISAGCVVYRRRTKEIEIVLIQPKGRSQWVLPKGIVNAGETASSHGSDSRLAILRL